MNKYVRAFFMPIMILAGIFTSTMCTLIFAPVAFCHWIKERKLVSGDLINDEEYLKSYHEQFKQ